MKLFTVANQHSKRSCDETKDTTMFLDRSKNARTRIEAYTRSREAKMVEFNAPENGVQTRVGNRSSAHEASQNGLSKEDARARDEAMLIKQLALQELHGSAEA